MTTRESIISVADALIRDKGFNAFSYTDISKSIGIKTASIHYHFPTKADLGIATIRDHMERLSSLQASLAGKTPAKQLEGFLSLYTKMKAEDQVCIVGSLATDLNTVDPPIREELKLFADMILAWVTAILDAGRATGDFRFSSPPRTKAMLVISTMMAALQLTRLTSKRGDFDTIKKELINNLTTTL